MDAAEGLRKLLIDWNIPRNSQPALQMAAFRVLLTKWNEKISLTANCTWEVLEPMFREAIWASRFYAPEHRTQLDIGSGAGFPALLLKMLNPLIQIELVESRERKCQFLETAVSHLGLTNVQVRQTRLADYLNHCPSDKAWDCISWKALKLAGSDLRQLHARGNGRTQFWMFHGRMPALEDMEMFSQFNQILHQVVPGMKDSNLTIFV
jgi:16S rRNA (guanine(527)-N(7))-methyltransferase RsmG